MPLVLASYFWSFHRWTWIAFYSALLSLFFAGNLVPYSSPRSWLFHLVGPYPFLPTPFCLYYFVMHTFFVLRTIPFYLAHHLFFPVQLSRFFSALTGQFPSTLSPPSPVDPKY